MVKGAVAMVTRVVTKEVVHHKEVEAIKVVGETETMVVMETTVEEEEEASEVVVTVVTVAVDVVVTMVVAEVVTVVAVEVVTVAVVEDFTVVVVDMIKEAEVTEEVSVYYFLLVYTIENRNKNHKTIVTGSTSYHTTYSISQYSKNMRAHTMGNN